MPLLVSLPVWLASPAAGHREEPPDGVRNRGVSAAPALPVIRPAPDFALLDTAGRPVRLSGLRGRVVLVSFFYTSCTTACPLLAARLARLARLLAERPTRASLLSVTVDPLRDSAAALAAYAGRFGVDARRWRFLRAEPERLGPVLAAYGEWTRTLPDGGIDHPARLYLVDPAGRVREIYGLGFFDEGQALIDIRALEREARRAPR